MAMGVKWAVALAVALSLSCVCGAAALRSRELQLEEPREIFQSDGGRVEAWFNIRALRDANVNVVAARVRLRQRGLVLPNYSDAAGVAYIEEGEGYVGIASGYSVGEASNVRRVRRGDVVAVPAGVAVWWYNSGDSELRWIGFGETSESLSSEGAPTSFALIGGGRQGGEEQKGRGEGQEYRGILHGFRREFLADAWDLDERQVDELLNRQQGSGIVLAERDVRFPQHSNLQHESHAHFREHIASGEFVYNIREGSADVRVRDAGIFNSANRFKLPILKNLNLGVTFGRLERDAILAPQWNVNGHAVLYIIRGNGELEITGNDGEQLVSQEVREGEAYAVPRFYPHGIRAGEEGLEWVAFHTTDQPLVEALAGRTSVYKQLPEEVAAAAFNVDIEQVREVRERRQRAAIILPGRARGRYF